MPTISIAMATFNGGKFIEQQLKSLMEQTKLPEELVISDDGSSDNTIIIAQKFAEKAPFPVHIHQSGTRKGYRRNFVEAAAICTSELIAFCDQDDIWYKEKLSEIDKHFDDSSVLLVHHNARIVDQGGSPVGILLKPGTHAAITKPLTSGPWTFALGFCQIFRRDLLIFAPIREQTIDFYFPDEQLAHDQWFFFLASIFGKIVYLEQPLVDYRQHDQNTFGLQTNTLSRLMTKLRQKLSNGGAFYQHLTAVAKNRVLILTAIAADESYSSQIQQKASAGAEQYQQFSEWLELRADTYRNRRFIGRLTLWIKLLRGDAYRSSAPWSFDKKAAMRDAVLGVVLGPMLDLIKKGFDRNQGASLGMKRSGS